MANLRIPLINRVQAAGRLTRDPEILIAQKTGKEYARAGFAYAAPKDTPAQFVDIMAFGYAVEKLMACRKGDPVIVEGRLQIDRYEKEGQEKKYISIIADRVDCLEWKDDGEHGSAATPPPARNDAQRVSTPPPHPASSADDDIPF
jgi:single-strand DNA-binding protein